jgi:hypothetical protein
MTRFLVALALLMPQESNEAETLFKKMEEKLLAAKTIHVTLKGVMAQEGMKIGLTTELHLGEKNQACDEFTLKNGRRELTGRCVSDGRKIAVLAIDGKVDPARDAPETLGRLLRARFARAGVTAATEALQLDRIAKQDSATTIGVSDFKLGDKDKVQDRDARKIDYKMTKAGEPDRQVTIWIDSATLLPLKRVITRAIVSLTEEYTVLEVDGNIDPAKFELPK